MKSMGRIFVGLVKCGAWGCFDEFNRLEEAVLSAVSMQIQAIQDSLKHHKRTCDLLGKEVRQLKRDAGKRKVCKFPSQKAITLQFSLSLFLSLLSVMQSFLNLYKRLSDFDKSKQMQEK